MRRGEEQLFCVFVVVMMYARAMNKRKSESINQSINLNDGKQKQLSSTDDRISAIKQRVAGG